MEKGILLKIAFYTKFYLPYPGNLFQLLELSFSFAYPFHGQSVEVESKKLKGLGRKHFPFVLEHFHEAFSHF